MVIQYLTGINETNKTKTLLFIEAGLQAYNAFNEKHPAACQKDKIISPIGYDFVECRSGVDFLIGKNKTVEIFGDRDFTNHSHFKRIDRRPRNQRVNTYFSCWEK